jgi:Tfp pilus assembly protein PilN
MEGLELPPVSVVSQGDREREFCSHLRHKYQRRFRWVASGLTASAAVLTVVGGLLVNWHLDMNIEKVDQELAQLRPATEQLAAKRTRLDSVVQPRTYLADVLHQPGLSSVLDELGAVLPESSWVNEFRMSEGKVDLTGQSRDFESMVPAIEESGLFENVQITRLGTADDNQTFALRLTLADGEAR